MDAKVVLLGVAMVALGVCVPVSAAGEEDDEIGDVPVLDVDIERVEAVTERMATEAALEVQRQATADVELDYEQAVAITERMATDLAVDVHRQAERTRRRITLMLTGNVAGNFAQVDCREDDGYQDLYWARHAAYYQALRRLSQQTDLFEPVALNVGNSLFPGALGRYLVTRGDSGAGWFAELIAEVPLAVHGIADRELAVPRTKLVEFLEAIEQRGIDLQAANLGCEDFEGAEAICEAIGANGEQRHFQIVHRGGVDIAVATVLDPRTFDELPRFQRQGVEITEPEEMLPALVEEMRNAADVVVVQHQVPPDDAAPAAYQLATRVEGIDLMVASQLIDAPDEAGRFDPDEPIAGGRMSVIEAAGTGTPIVSANSGEHGVINVELDIVRTDAEDRDWKIRDAVPRRTRLEDVPFEESTRELLEQIIEEYCTSWGEPIGDHAELAHSFELEQLQQFILEVMRFATHTEVALMHQGAFRNQQQFPLTDELTRADIYTTLPFEHRLVTVDIKGEVLAGLADQLSDTLVAAGLQVDDGDVHINGRSVSEDRTYRVAINDFLSEGGASVFSSGDIDNAEFHHPPFSEAPPSIGEIVIEYVDAGRHLRGGEERRAIDASGNFPNLEDKFLWTVNGSLNASYNQVAVQNPDEAYDENPLTVQSTDQVNLEGRLVTDADSRLHGWNNRLDVQYASARVDDENDGFETTRDRIRLRSRYRYKRLRAMHEGKWYVPDPFVEGQAESEFRRPDDREWHRLALRALTGASFQLLDPLEFKLGVNVSRDVFEPGARPTWGVNTSYTLARVSPVQLLDRPVRIQSEIEYFYNDIGRDNIHEARSTNRLYFAIFEEFFFTTTFNAFAYRDDTVGEFGTNTELTVGVNYEWERVLQNF